MSVHLQIANQISKHIDGQQQFKQLDGLREAAIEEALTLAKQQKEFTTSDINAITNKMNEIAKKFHFPMRKQVTREMVLEYSKRS
ncbi:DUF2533 family protein [Alkalihalobacillus sp. LMS39]|uniref:DUF2533 family protein n=1 Tax=Alkalihalobacillus sp. LMS39 TaxID=2924032 RepID=UPI001FB29596|nr:DUF2533 family protein [Alkalihalobacillus sp. LMS39]UOE95628.1 YpbS family protein [Alkalihalobacillus sp. LMS39]